MHTTTLRALRFIPIPLLVVGAIMSACKDGGPTHTVHATHATASPGSLAPTERIDAALIPATGGVTVQVLSRARFPDELDATFDLKREQMGTVVHVEDPSQVVTAKITVAPGGSFGWHTHHGPAMVSLVAGGLTIVHADCVVQRYRAGQAFVDAGQGHVHVGFNPSESETVAYVTFLSVPEGKGPTIPVQGPSC